MPFIDDYNVKKENFILFTKLTLFAPWGISGLILSSPFIAYRVIVDKNSDKCENVSSFALICAVLGPISPLFSIPDTISNLRRVR